MQIAPALRVWLILALACLITLVFWPSAAVYAAQWSNFSNITYTHGWLIVLICLVLLWRARGAIAATPAHPSPVGLVALAACVWVWLVCYRANNQDLHITVFPLLIWLAIAAAFGRRMAVLLAFPLAFFVFALPSWAQLTVPLQRFTVFAVQAMLHVTGPTAEISGDRIHIPNGTFNIEEGCSGLHFLIVGLAIAALNGELRRDPWRTRAAQLVFMTWLALLANWVRVYTVIERGYQTDMQTYLVRVSHYWFGWCVFAVALVIFFWATDRLGPAPRPDPQVSPPTPGSHREVAGLAATVAVLMSLPAVSFALRALQAPPQLTATIAPQPGAPWSGQPASERSSWVPQFVGPDRERRLMYDDGSGNLVEAYGVLYAVQRQDAKLYGSHSSLLGPHLQLRASREIDTGSGRFRESTVADSAGRRFLIWSRYQVAGRDFVGELPSQLWFGLVSTVSKPPASLIAIRAACGSDCQGARQLLLAFVSSGGVR